ncbi:uncharacterized protein At4g15970-like [Hibiscus syriacus]|uniref:uncharacterized protein At4g15970-like n=1 Tax=Hibiscus syriacus TaxID=106335 RepID=UPI001921987F|nr:uncharacterized protein At4g15970-like [Hibiscus syriacus]
MTRRISRPPFCRLIVSLMFFIFICFIFHRFSDNPNTQSIVVSKLDSDKKTLLRAALMKASMPDRTVILTVVNGTWAKPGSILDVFLESFQVGVGTEHLLNHLLVIAEDSRSFENCKSKHPHCFELENSTKKLAEKPPGTQGSLMFSQTRLMLLTRVIEFGYNVVFTNADVMWLRNPLSKLVANFDLSIGCGLYPIDAKTFGIEGDGGFFHLKANARTIEFIRICNMNRVLYPDSEHQSLCKISEKQEYVGLIGVEENFGSLCLPCDLNQKLTVQANCCDDIDSKIHDMKLVLNDWRNFVHLSSNNVSSNRSSVSWRAPVKCFS